MTSQNGTTMKYLPLLKSEKFKIQRILSIIRK